MNNDNNLKNLISDLTPLDEYDDDEYSDEKIEIVTNVYHMKDLIDNVGEEDFKHLFYLISFKEIDIKWKALFCKSLLEKIKEVYDFEFDKSFDLFSEETVEEILNFVKFLEFDNLDFIKIFWSNIIDSKLDIKMFDRVAKYYLNHAKSLDISKNIDKTLSKLENPKLIKDFFDVDNHLDFLKKITEKNRNGILLSIYYENRKET